ncbi:MAG: hypothetical protein GXO27_01240 [Chlorobi bacterium]|nr:hypothetical protein [Chlorobiota bacterium]
MAILAKIQKSSGLIVGMIGLALFAFIIMDLISNSSSLFRPSTEYVGKVNGEKIPTDEFRERLQAVQQQYGSRMSSSRVLKEVWDQFVREKLMESQYKKAGITVPDVRVYDRLKNDPGIRRMFTNEQGIFDENAFLNYLDELNAMDKNDENYRAWKNYINSLRQMEGEQIYANLVKAAMVPTVKEGAWEYHKENDRATFDFVIAPYELIPDSAVTVTPEDVKKYIARHEDLYKVDESKDILYVKFVNEPSPADYAETEAALKELIADRVVFNAQTGTTDTLKGFASLGPEEVEAFLKQHSDEMIPLQWYRAEDLPVVIRDSVLALEPGGVYGPVRDPGKFTIYKVVDKWTNIPAKAKASHILISYEGVQGINAARSKEEARRLADSLLQVIKRNPAKFEELARQYSDDKVSGARGGDLGEFTVREMIEPFADYVFHARKGDIGIVETPLGYHIVRIDDLSPERTDAVKLAMLVRHVEPGEATLDSIYTLAAEYYAAARKAGDLNEVKEPVYRKPLPVKKIKRYESMLPGLGDQPAIVRWLYEPKTKVGDIRRFETEDGYVIVQYTNETPEGLMPVEEAMVLVEPILRKKKKFDMLKDKMKGNTLEEIAANCGGQKGHAEDVTLANPVIPAFGKEPKVVAVAFIVPEGQISKPVEGNAGAYVVKPLKVERAAELENYYNYIAELERRQQADLMNRIIAALKEKAKIKDNRAALGY